MVCTVSVKKIRAIREIRGKSFCADENGVDPCVIEFCGASRDSRCNPCSRALPGSRVRGSGRPGRGPAALPARPRGAGAARPPARGSGVCRDPQDRPAQRRGPRCPGNGPLRAGETSGSGERAPDSPGPRLRPVDGGTFSRAEPRGSGPVRRGGAASAQELQRADGTQAPAPGGTLAAKLPACILGAGNSARDRSGAQKDYPEDADVLYYAAGLYSRLWNAAVADLVKTAPASYRVHQVAGEALEAQGRDEQAIKEYQKALDLNPKAP